MTTSFCMSWMIRAHRLAIQPVESLGRRLAPAAAAMWAPATIAETDVDCASELAARTAVPAERDRM